MARTTFTTLAAVLIAIPALAQVLPGVSPPVGIFMDFDARPGTASLEVMKSVVGELLKPSGLSLDWHYTGDTRGTETFARVVVLKFRGICRIESPSQPANDFGSLGDSRALGITRLESGRVLPYSEVECDRVRAALSLLERPRSRVERQTVFGLALARIVAHELYHVLTRSTQHSSNGLMKASHSLAELISTEDLPILQRKRAAGESPTARPSYRPPRR